MPAPVSGQPGIPMPMPTAAAYPYPNPMVQPANYYPNYGYGAPMMPYGMPMPQMPYPYPYRGGY
jgi:hypothetical protein